MSSSPSLSTSIANSSSSIPTITPISNIISIKLTLDNYPLWKAQLLHYFRGQDLYGYLDGTVTLPPQTIDAPHPNTGTINTIPNPAHSQWLRQDSLILSTLMFFMTEGVLAQIVSHAISHEVWQALETKFSSQSGAGTIQARTQLANAKKGSQSANDYFLDTSHSSTVLCQVCGKPGHSARKCYHRFDLTYQDPPHSQNKQAFVTTNNGDWENDWHADTGATYHITHDMANLNLKSDDYNGTDQIQVGNGQGIDEGTPGRHANSVSSPVIVAAEHSLSSSIPAEPPQPTSDPTVTQGNTNTHAMVTRSRNNIFTPKSYP
ncbi:hypothetical protein F0562_017226 [Nyssa sinensis]|uniref:CCHC-type domain-containing protein n=1 Tax=Nyssa sinensis TaxID=561372 RepID=A0A5J4ZH15_9ASTE|nr:hypothetical protein F0562_017226 [Nyssa sinensis]